MGPVLFSLHLMALAIAVSSCRWVGGICVSAEAKQRHNGEKLLPLPLINSLTPAADGLSPHSEKKSCFLPVVLVLKTHEQAIFFPSLMVIPPYIFIFLKNRTIYTHLYTLITLCQFICHCF